MYYESKAKLFLIWLDALYEAGEISLKEYLEMIKKYGKKL
jgi:hypothetical protein